MPRTALVVLWMVGAMAPVCLLSACGSDGKAATPAAGGAGGAAGAAGAGGAGTSGSGGSAGGACQPTLVQPSDNPNAQHLLDLTLDPNDFLAGFRSVKVLAEDVYYATDQGLFRMPKAGGAATTVASSADVGPLFFNTASAYWLQSAALYTVGLSASNATPSKVTDLALSPGTDRLVNVDDAYAYYYVAASMTLERAELASGTVTPVLSGVQAQGFVRVMDMFYFVGPNDTIERVPAAGGQAELVGAQDYIVWSVGVDGSQLYFGGSDALYRVAQPFATEVMYAPGIGFVDGVFPQTNRLLFSGWQGTVGWVMKDGSSCAMLVDSVFDFHGWDYDDTSAFIAYKNVLYRIPL